MRRTLLYDTTTGEILHAHYEVRVVGGRGDSDAHLSAPAAVDLDAALVELISRGLDADHMRSVVTNAAPQSSRRLERSVDPATGRLRSRRLEELDSADDEED